MPLKASQTYKALWKYIALIKCLKSSLRAFEAVWRGFLIANSRIYHNRNNEHLILLYYWSFYVFMQEVALIAFGVLGKLLAGVSQCTEKKPKAKRCVAYSLFRNLTQRQRCHDAKNEYGCHLFFTKSSDFT